MTLNRLLLAACAAAPLALGGGAFAQAGTPQGFDPAQRMCEMQDARHAAMLAYTETYLQITPAQQAAWKKYAEATKAAHEPVRKLCTEVAGQPAPATWPARQAQMQKMMEAKVQGMKAVLPALDQLYAALSPEQKKLADAMGPGGGMGHGRGRGFGHGWH